MLSIDKNHLYSAKVIWKYMQMHQPLCKADCICVFGSMDINVARWAARLYLDGYAPRILFSGKKGILNKNRNTTEADLFASEAKKMGVVETDIFLEKQATNTGENCVFTIKFLRKHRIPHEYMLVVHKPYMERRTYATLKKFFPDQKFTVSSEPVSFENYLKRRNNPIRLINAIVGDCDRIVQYPKEGFQIVQHMPDEVFRAMQVLIDAGYDKSIVSG